MITIIRTIQASSVRNGDVVITAKGLDLEKLDGMVLEGEGEQTLSTRTVGQVKNGRKNTELLDEDGKSWFYAPLETMVAVIREEKTEEERKAERDAYVRDELTQIVESGIVEFAPEALFAAALKGRNDEPRSSHALVFNTMDFLLKGQARYDILSHVHELYTGEDRPTKGDIFRAFALVLAGILEPTRRNARVLSRSTSHTSNLADDVLVEVATEYLDGLYTRSLRQAVYQIWAERESY